MRAVTIERKVAPKAEGSCLVTFGATKVLCTASVETSLPSWRRQQAPGHGWVTAEYGMLPRATNTRTRREAAAGKQSGRTQEIQRLIGRSLRAVVDMQALGENQITLDCDVLEADGGTRTASITGAYVALAEAIGWLKERGLVKGEPLRDTVAAVSLRHLPRHAGARSRLSRGRRGAHRCEFRADRRRQVRRDPGDGGAASVLARRARDADGACREGHRRAHRAAARGARRR